MERNLQTINQRKYYDREKFTYEEKQRICFKSDNQCCHCGKKIFVGYEATVDHFIPLNKGGSNQFLNLIPLCKKCNEEKEDKLYNIDYITYIKDKYRKELSNYLDSYVQVIDYVQRHRLLAYDEYKQEVFVVPKNLLGRTTYKNKKIGVKCSYTLKYATWNDLDKMTDYLIRYLIKNDSLDNEKVARDNIMFWMKFGCIYYIEKNNEVTTMFALTIKHVENNNDFRGIYNQPNMYIFPYYLSDISEQIILDMIVQIPKLICDENKLSFIPLNIIMLNVEKMQYLLSYAYHTAPTAEDIEGFISFHIVFGEGKNSNDYENIHKEYEEMSDDEKVTYHFLNKFNDITNKLIKFFEQYEDRYHIGWMISTVLSNETIHSSGLIKYINNK